MNQPKPWTQDEMVHLYNARTGLATKPWALIGAELGRHSEACRDKFRKTDWEKLGLVQNVEEQNNRYVYKTKFVEKVINAIDKRHNMFQLRADALADVFERAIEALPRVPMPVYKPVNAKKKYDSEDAGLLLSDIHVGHQHTLEETGGISQYTEADMIRRCKNLQQAVVDITEVHRNAYHIPKLHIFCAGDIVAGMNAAGAWSPLYIASAIADQTIAGYHAIAGMINYWLGMFEEIHFHGIGGNHGRTAPMGLQKDHDNWDYICYKFLQAIFKDNPRVKFNIPKTWWLQEKVRGHNFLLVHGDYTKSGALPIVALQKFEQKMSSILKNNADYTLAGHYHNSAEMTTNSGKILLNGSFVGSDVYSLRNCHAASIPEQKFFGIHDEHGITWKYDINLDTPRDAKKGA